jgi:hypothetical protein
MSIQLGSVAPAVTGGADAIDTATPIPYGQAFTRISAGGADTAVRLPVDRVGAMSIIYNGTGNAKKVYPPNANSNINAVGAGGAISIANGAVGRFIVAPNSALNAGGVQYDSC